MKKIKEILNNKFFGNIWVRLGFLAFALDIIVESLSRHSFIAGLSHILINPLAFLYNCILIFFTLSFVALFKKRIFVGSVISALWITLGVVNCIMLFRRKTPFTAPDLRNITDFFEILSKYFNTVQVVLIIALIALAVAGLVVLAIKSPKTGAKIN